MLFIVSWETGLLGERVGEAAVLGPPNSGGSNLPTKPRAHCDAWMSSNSAMWRHCKRFHQDLSVEAYPQCPEQEESDSDVFVLGRECASDSDHDESPERSMAEISTMVLDEDTRNQVANRVDNCNYFETAGGGRARLSIAHSDVPLSILQHVTGTRG